MARPSREDQRKQQVPNPGAASEAIAARDIAHSNTTSQLFMGGRQYAWMNAAPIQPSSIRPPATSRHINGTVRNPSIIGNVPTTMTTEVQSTAHLPSPAASEEQLLDQAEHSIISGNVVPALRSPTVSLSAENRKSSLQTGKTAQQPTEMINPTPLQNSPMTVAVPSASETIYPPERTPVPPPSRSVIDNSITGDLQHGPRGITTSTGHGPIAAASEMLPSPVTRPSSSTGRNNPSSQQNVSATRPGQQSVSALNDIDAFVAVMGGWPHLGQASISRLTLLRHALSLDDFYFLWLHQILALATVSHAEIRRFANFGDAQHRGLSQLESLLGPMPQQVLIFSVSFPQPLYPLWLSSAPCRRILDQMSHFLDIFGQSWSQDRQQALQRLCPPWPEEVFSHYSTRSSVLQEVIFGSLHQHLTRGTHASGEYWWAACWELFREGLASIWQIGQGTQAQRDAQIHDRILRYRRLIQQRPKTLDEWTASLVPMQGNQQNPAPQNIHVRPSEQQGYGQPLHPRQNSLVAGSDNTLGPGRATSVRAQANAVQSPHMLHTLTIPVQHGRAHLSQIPTTLNNGSLVVSNAGQPLRSQAGAALPHHAVTLPLTHSGYSNLSPVSNHDGPVTLPAGPGQRTRSYPRLFPNVGYELPQSTAPNPSRTALHQAYLSSPIAKKVDLTGQEDPDMRLYQYLSRFAMPPQALGVETSYYKRSFLVSSSDIGRKVASAAPGTSVYPPVRYYTNGSCVFRLRCVLSAKDRSPAAHEWSSKDSVWPSACFITLNGHQLEVRRKVHHGKDLAVDVTDFVKDGINTLEFSLLRNHDESTKKFYSIAVEIIEVADDEHVQKAVKDISFESSLTRIITALKRSQVDDDVVLIDPHLSIDLKDPFTFKVFEKAVRGLYCLHQECFDLDTFLATRRSRVEGGPTSPDEWRCPICRADARPDSLVKDLFLQSVRDSLEKQGQRTDAILVNPDGEWKPKQASRKESPSLQGQKRRATTHEASRENKRHEVTTIIELDD